MLKFFMFISLFLISCDENEDVVEDPSNSVYSQVIVSLQDSDGVSFVNSNNLDIIDEITIGIACSEILDQADCELIEGCIWHNMDDGMSHCMMDHSNHDDHHHDMGEPHDIVVDNTHGYWFTTAMMGRQVLMYSVNDNEFLASFNTNAMPALLSLDEVNSKIYVSGGNPSMGSTNIILELEYGSDNNENYFLNLIEEWDVNFLYAHGIHFDETSGEVFTVSKTNDFIAKFNPDEAQVPFINPMIASLDSSISIDWSFDVKRLMPVEISGKYPYIFVTCSAGEWNSESIHDEIPGQIQMWDMRDLTLISTYNLETYSRPWHIEISPIEDKFYVALLGGEGANGSSDAGVVCIEYAQNDTTGNMTMTKSWMTTSSQYGGFHGIDLHADCNGNYHVFSTERTGGKIYKFDAMTGEELGSLQLLDPGSSGEYRTAGIDSYIPSCDTNCNCD